jgi:hypothetical protein
LQLQVLVELVEDRRAVVWHFPTVAGMTLSLSRRAEVFPG